MERWRKRLHELELNVSMIEAERLLIIDTEFRKEFPGNYILDEHYRPTLGRFVTNLPGRFVLDVIFDDNSEKTLWLLKYS